MRGSQLTVVLEQAVELGGTERVVELVLRRHPHARVFAPVFADSNVPAGQLPDWAARAQPIGRPRRRRRPLLAPLYARDVARARLDATDVLLSFSGHGWALAASAPEAHHVSYISGLPRSLYEEAHAYRRGEPLALRPLWRAALPKLRGFNERLARLPDRLVTNSRSSAAARRDRYGVHVEVLHPPVRTEFFTPAARERRHALFVGRLVGHKYADVAIEAALLAGLAPVVAGGGRALDALRRRYGRRATFTGWVSDDELRELYRSAHALICPSVEEFGIVMAEAQACGTPVVAPRAGGALDIVRDGLTGRLTDETGAAAFARALRALPSDPGACRAAGAAFSEEAFGERLDAILSEAGGQRPARGPQSAPAAAFA
jgi:glycosyltransferase involved in cell wall biosynthesis